jgi:F-type H+-transporting ATPase subunit epsilon
MKLRIITPTEVAGTFDDVAHLRAEDASGAFGILRGHADFLTSLSLSVVSWHSAQGSERHCAVRGGMLTMSDGEDIAIATPEAVVGDDLETLENEVLTRFRQEVEEESAARASTERLQIAAIRRICAYLRAERPPQTMPIRDRAGEG